MIGIDVSKRTLAVTCLDPLHQRVRWQMEVPNTVEGIQRLLARTPAQMAWVVEPTGRYSLLVTEEAAKHQQLVLMAEPKRAKAFLGALSPRAKTDRLDSHGLAHYGLTVALRPYPIKAPAVARVDELLAARRGLSEAIVRLRQQQAALPAAASFLAAGIAALETQQAALAGELAAAAQALPDTERLDDVPGIGPVIATAVAACLAAKRFPSAGAFVAYIGLDPRVRDSGERRGKRALSKQGPPEVRRLLYLAAQANLRSKDSPFREQYDRERAKGLASTAALNAVARKLARLCWSLVQHGTTYNPDRVYRQLVAQDRQPEVGSTTSSGGGEVGNSKAQPESAAVVHLSTATPTSTSPLDSEP